jgi:DNA-binding MarR family transcriptional regulator
MDSQPQQLHNRVNHAIIKCRGVYSQWAKKYGVSYNRMLVFYTIRDTGYCTQKQMCDQYLLPRQTMNNIVAALCREGLLAEDPARRQGREKAYVLTAAGAEYSAKHLASLNAMEDRAAQLFGAERIQAMADLVLEYDRALETALGEIEL